MDNSLRFAKEAASKAAPSAPATVAEKDFRGMTFPSSFIKVKLSLARMQSGDRLAALLDDGGINNVAGAIAAEGHKVISQDKVEGHWSLLVEKS
jgi:TusA-related sulfurtransferase